jgi:hypothetical protein
MLPLPSLSIYVNEFPTFTSSVLFLFNGNQTSTLFIFFQLILMTLQCSPLPISSGLMLISLQHSPLLFSSIFKFNVDQFFSVYLFNSLLLILINLQHTPLPFSSDYFHQSLKFTFHSLPLNVDQYLTFTSSILFQVF